MPRQSINTDACQLRAKRRREGRSSPAIWLETFPAARWTFDSFSNLKATRSRRWISFREGWLQSRAFTGKNGRSAHPEPARTDREFGSLGKRSSLYFDSSFRSSVPVGCSNVLTV